MVRFLREVKYNRMTSSKKEIKNCVFFLKIHRILLVYWENGIKIRTLSQVCECNKMHHVFHTVSIQYFTVEIKRINSTKWIIQLRPAADWNPKMLDIFTCYPDYLKAFVVLKGLLKIYCVWHYFWIMIFLIDSISWSKQTGNDLYDPDNSTESSVFNLLYLYFNIFMPFWFHEQTYSIVTGEQITC